MPTRLIQVVAFVNVAPAATVALPHNININDVPKRPDYVAADVGDFGIVVTATTVTVTNNNLLPATVNIWLELKHTIPRELGGGVPNLVPQPFIAASGGSGSGGPAAVIFDDAIVGTDVNIRSDRASNQSPIDNTKAGITNLSSKTGSADPTAQGCTDNYSTIGGGDDNGATGAYSTIPGGRKNFASGLYAYAEGFGSISAGEGSHSEGAAIVGGNYAHAEGFADIEPVGASSEASHAEARGFINGAANAHAESHGTILGGANDAHAEGSGTVQVNAIFAHAEGRNTLCDVVAEAAHAEGDTTVAAATAAHAEGISTRAGNDASHAEGQFTEAAGQASHAEGQSTYALGAGSHAEGDGTWAEGDASHAQGADSNAHRDTQFAHGGSDDGGFGIHAGYAQTSWLEFRGQTSAGANVNLKYGVSGTTSLGLQDLRSYDLRVSLVANGKQAGPTYLTRTLKKYLNARCVGGVATITGNGASESFGDDAAAVWTLTITAVGNTLVLTFSPGTDNLSEINIACHVEWTEIRFLA